MRLRGKLLTDVEADDVLALVHDEVPESVELDYKEKLPGDPGSERREFAKDVAAMANTRGGVLLYGIAERVEDGRKTGVPERIVGVGPIAPDHEMRRLEQIVRDLSDPPLTQCSVRAFTVPSGEVVVGVGVPRSLLGPHATNGSYYRRGATSNYCMPTLELRQMFLERDAWDREVRTFRDDRVTETRGGRTIPNLDVQGSFFLHALPLGRLHNIVDIVAQRSALDGVDSGSFRRARPNLDGHLLYNEDEGVCKIYAQWLRCGGVEYYSSLYHHTRKDEAVLDLDAVGLALDALRYARIALKFMHRRLAIDPPYAILLAVFDVKGGSIPIKGWESVLPLVGPKVNLFDKDVLMLPAVVIQDAEADVKAAMLPLFDMIWQAAGFDDCFMRRAKTSW